MPSRLSLSSALASTAASLSAASTTAIYWADMSIPACTSTPHPRHLHSDKLFESREECCEVMLPWLEGCADKSTEESEDESSVNTVEILGETTGSIRTRPPVDEMSEAGQAEVKCTSLSIMECTQSPLCERVRQRLDNGLWIGICVSKESAATSTEQATEEAPAFSSTAEPTVGISTNSPTENEVETDAPTAANVETDAPTAASIDTSAPTAASIDTSASTAASIETAAPTILTRSSVTPPSSITPQDNQGQVNINISTQAEIQEPALYCAQNFQELQAGCSTAPRCDNNPCPSGMFCFPYQECTSDLQYVAETIVDGAATLIDTAIDGSLLPQPSPHPTLFPTPYPSEEPSPNPSTKSPIQIPTTASPTRRYTSSDFIVELIKWTNIGMNDSFLSSNDRPQLMSSNSTPRTFAPTSYPTGLPTNLPTSHPVSESPTSHPTIRPAPTIELILPCLADTTISNSRPDENFGNLEAIAVNGGNIDKDSDRFDALLSFDLSLLSSSYEIVEATLKLYTMNSCNGGGNIYIAADTLWDESTVTWNDAPQAQGIRIASLKRQTSKQWEVLDVTSAIAGWRRGYHAIDTLSLRIMSSTADSLCMFAGGESGEEYRPSLIVRYSTDEQRLQTMSLDYGYDNVVDSHDVQEVEPSAAASMQEGEAPALVEPIEEVTLLATEDASISNIRQSVNFGSQNAIVVDGGDYQSGTIRGSNEESEQFDALIKFDISSVNVDKVDSLELKIHVTKGCEYGGDIYATQGKDWDQDSVTWGDAPRVSGGPLGSLRIVDSREWYTVDLNTSLLTSVRSLTLRVSSSVNSRCMYTSIDRGEETAPRLIVKIRSMLPQTMSAGFLGTVATPLRPTLDLIPTTGNFILIVASDDSTIDANPLNSNQSEDYYLRVDYNERSRVIHDVVIRFDLAQMHGGVLPQSALLTLFTEGPCANAGTFMTTEGNSEWSESDITWTSAPNYVDNGSYEGGKMIGTFGAVEGQRWYGFNVVEALTEAVLMRKQAITFRLTSGGMQSCSYSSIQSGRPPKILVAF